MQEAAKDVVSQEVISGEVSKFMAKSGSMQQEDLSALEEVIRQRLSGRTPPCATAPADDELDSAPWCSVIKSAIANVITGCSTGCAQTYASLWWKWWCAMQAQHDGDGPQGALER